VLSYGVPTSGSDDHACRDDPQGSPTGTVPPHTGRRVESTLTHRQSGMQLIADRYEVRGLIGRGGSGAVWRGEDLQLKRPIAIKQIVLSDTGSTRSRTRAMREAQAVAKLDAPGVVRVYDVHEDGTQVCLIMELIDAPSLARLVRRNGTFTPRRAARVGLSMLHTLTAVHAAGIVHRDIKPSNVLVGDCGVHITDFGIALLTDDPTLTAAGSVLGTPTYMAPEQARGERVGPPADLYGLGATVYFAVEGRAPFDHIGSLETTRAVRDQPHRPGCRLGDLTGIVDRLLCKDPAARPDTADVTAALEAIADGPNDGTPHGDAAAAGDDPGDLSRGPRAQPTGIHAVPVAADATADDDDAPDVPGPPDRPAATAPPGDDRRQLLRTVTWAVALLALLAVALVLLFLAVRDNPDTPATVGAVLMARPIMGASSG
jgi:hypothetical protein